jgi:hypothetical protein
MLSGVIRYRFAVWTKAWSVFAVRVRKTCPVVVAYV